ncbi:DUF6161 domain-containing protein, partial [Leptospira ellisii]|uniref:DUF6161 domain-containing protein n=1 Tax=Leptospira ellisii TaxID=2023197 RepID=UPI0013FDD542
TWQNFSLVKIGKIHYQFRTLHFNLNQAITYFNERKDEASFENELNELNHTLRNDTRFLIFSNSDEGVKIRSGYSENEQENDAIFDYFHKYFDPNYLNKDYLSGFIKAVLIDNPKYFSNNFEEIISKGVDLNNELQRVSNDSMRNSYTLLSELKIKVEELNKSGENIFTTHKNRITEFEREYKEKFDDILKNYEEKLRISGPAKYWEEMEIYYRKKGRNWRNLSFLIGGLTIAFISFAFFFYPTQWNPEEYTIQSVKGTLLLGIAISTFIYLLRISIKITLSNYHLSVDAKERFQLSHFFLSMAKEGVLEKEDRNLVLQSLFG